MWSLCIEPKCKFSSVVRGEELGPLNTVVYLLVYFGHEHSQKGVPTPPQDWTLPNPSSKNSGYDFVPGNIGHLGVQK